MRSENRKNSRLYITENYFYYSADKKEKTNCILNNISITGACITSYKSIKLEEIIFLHFNNLNNIAVKSQTVWKNENQYGLQFLLDTNLEFENISIVMNNIKII
jgi:hypothetical protein